MIRLAGFVLLLAAFFVFYLFLVGVSDGIRFVGPGEIDFGGPFSNMGSRFPEDTLLLMASIGLLLFGVRFLLGPAPKKGPKLPEPDPTDEAAVRRYQTLMAASHKPNPRIPGAMLLNSYLILSILISLYFGGRHQMAPQTMGVLAAILAAQIAVGFILLVLAVAWERSFGRPGNILGLLVHLGAAGCLVAAVLMG